MMPQLKIPYIILSRNTEAIKSYLYAKEYTIIDMKKCEENVLCESILAFKGKDNNMIRRDVIFIMEYFELDSVIVRYEDGYRKVNRNGSESILEIAKENDGGVSYIGEGLFFSFKSCKRYWKPNKKEDFRKGMKVEYFNNNKWNERIVENVNSEYDDMYKLLIKYDKLRVLYNEN